MLQVALMMSIVLVVGMSTIRCEEPLFSWSDICKSINKDNLIIKYWKLFKLELCCCFVDKESDKSAMQHRVEMNIDAIVDANATIDIDDVNRDNGVDEYHQLWRTVVFVEVSTIMKTF